MSEKLGEARIDVVANLEPLKQGFRQAESQIRVSSSGMEGSIEKVRITLARARNALLLFAFAWRSITFFKDSAAAFIKAESAIKGVEDAIRKQGLAWKYLQGEVKSVTSALQAKTTYGDEEQQEALARLITLSKDYGKSIRALPLVLDVASATGRGLSEVADAIGRALAGNTRILSQIVPEFAALSEEQKKNIDVMKLLADTYEGRAEAMANTTGGKITQMANQWGDLKERVGALVLLMTGPAVKNMLETFTALNTIIGAKGDAQADVMGSKESIAKALQIAELQKKILNWQGSLAGGKSFPGIDKVKTDLDDALETMSKLIEEYKILRGIDAKVLETHNAAKADVALPDDTAKIEALNERTRFQSLKKWQHEQFLLAEDGRKAQAEMEKKWDMLIAEDGHKNWLAWLEKRNKELESADDEMEAFADQAARNMQDAFADFLFDPFDEGLEGMVRGFANAMRRMLANQLALNIFRSMGLAPVASAKGNVFSGGSVVPFAMGGVVNSPSVFALAGNRMGIMGEAGPEAVMPLKRGSDGKLGVESKGGATTIVNLLDPGLLDGYLRTPAGGRAIVNVIANSRREVRQVLQ